MTFDVDTEKQHSAEYDQINKKLTWNISTLKPNEEVSMRVKFFTEKIPGKTPIVQTLMVSGNHKKELGPISLSFEIPHLICADVKVKAVTVDESGGATVKRWLRSSCKVNCFESKVDVANVKKSVW